VKLDVGLLLFERVCTSIKTVVFIYDIDLASSRIFRSSSLISDDKTSIEVHQEGKITQDPSEKIMAP
jgi:hypothetical protein